MLVQPYSPDLFRLGDLPGPRLLMEALRGKATPQELKKEWKSLEIEKQSGHTRQGTYTYRVQKAPTLKCILAYVFVCVMSETSLSSTHLWTVDVGHLLTLNLAYV